MRLLLRWKNRIAALVILSFVALVASPPVRATRNDAQQKLFSRIRALKQRLPQYKDRREYTTGAIREGYERTITENLRGGTTYLIMAIGCDNVQDLDMKLYDSRGVKVDQDIKDDTIPVVRVEPPSDGVYTIKIQMLKIGNSEQLGHFAYQVFFEGTREGS